MMEQNSKIYVAGHRGMVGSAIVREIAAFQHKYKKANNQFSMNNSKIDSITLSTGILILFSLASTYMLSSLGFFIDIPISIFTFPSGVLLAFLLLIRSFKLKTILISGSIFTILFLLGAALVSHLFDYSFDGQWYHQETIVRLVDGWNPFLNYPEANGICIWTQHYAKCLETIAATICVLFQNLETGKLVNLLLLISTALLSWNIIYQIYPKLSLLSRSLFIILLVLNPVCCAQLFTYYIDFSLYYYLILGICFAFLINKGKYLFISSLGLFFVIILAIGTKFNMFFFIELMVFFTLIWFLIKKEYKSLKRVLWISLSAALLGCIVVSYHPYVTNWVYNGNPMYPLLGGESVDIMTVNTPLEFQGKDRFTNFVISYLTPTKIPDVDARINGYGLSFGILLIIGIIAVILSVYKNRTLKIEDYILLLAITSTFIFEQSWWARYNPQLWLVVPITFLKFAKIKSKWISIIYFALSLLCILPTLGFSLLNAYKKYIYINAVHHVLEDKKIEGSNIFPQTIYSFRPDNTTFTNVSVDSIPENERLSIHGYFQSGSEAMTIVRADEPTQRKIWESISAGHFLFMSSKPYFINNKVNNEY